MSHLGHIISHDCDDYEDLRAKKAILIGQVNRILCVFRNVNCSTKTRLVKSYCISFYGAEIWDFSHKEIEAIHIAWRKDIRRIYGDCPTSLTQYSSQDYAKRCP